MRTRGPTLFRRLMFAIVGTALLVAVISGAIHFRFAAGLIEESVRSQLEGALATSMADLERDHALPAQTDLRVMAASPVLDDLLTSEMPERLLDQIAAERLLLNVYQAEPGLYSMLLFVDAPGTIRAAVDGGKRLRPTYASLTEDSARLFRRIEAAPMGTVLFQGPLRHADGRYSVLAGIAKRDPDTAGFGGAVLAKLPLDRFIERLRATTVFDHPAAWLGDRDGRTLVGPRDGAGPEDVVVRSTTADTGGLAGLFHLAYRVPAEVAGARLRNAEEMTLVVLLLVAAGSTLLAVLLTRQLTIPLRRLAWLAGTVTRGDLSQRIEDRWGGEEGRLAEAFNRMLDVLNVTTVSRAYVDSIMASMEEAVLVVTPDGDVETANRAAVQLFSSDPEALVGSRLVDWLDDVDTRRRIEVALHDDEPLSHLETVLGDAGAGPRTVWLSATPLGSEAGDRRATVVVARDVTAQVNAQHDLERAHRQLEFHVDNSPLAVVEWDSEYRLRRWSGSAQALFGWRADEVIGKRPDDWKFVVEEDYDAAWNAVVSLAEGEPRNVCRNRNYRKDGTVVHCEWHNSLMLDENGRPLSVLSLAQDVTESARLSEELSHQATHDALTGLQNRWAFDRELQAAIADVERSDDSHVLCFIDLDQFKVVNDSCGHAAGDDLLRQVGNLLRNGVRRKDVVARLGGDEFGILLRQCGTATARDVANNLLTALREHPFVCSGTTFRISASIGLVPIDAPDCSMAEVMSAADSACLAAKNDGRNRVCVQKDRADVARARGEARWVSRLDDALSADRFFLAAQPIVPVQGGEAEVERFEILLRMIDENGETVMPGAFVPAAERYHMMARLDRWVVRRTMELIASSPVLRDGGCLCFVNLSGQTLGDETFVEFVSRELSRTKVAAGKLCFEITETAAVHDYLRANAFIESLSGLGCRFALDDFGAGVSSFAYLKKLPVDFLKIDGMFVRDAVDDPASLALVRSINDVGHAMGKQTIAEFVESPQILELMTSLGVDHVQGYAVGRPAPARARFGPPPPRLVVDAR